MKILYLSMEEVLQTYQRTIEYSGGGASGTINVEALEGALAHIQNDDYYPTFEEKLTHLFYSVCQLHCFQDGNKRIAIALGAYFLIKNGYMLAAKTFMPDMENIVYHVASRKIEKPLLGEIIAAHISGECEDEALKVKIFEAITRLDS